MTNKHSSELPAAAQASEPADPGRASAVQIAVVSSAEGESKASITLPAVDFDEEESKEIIHSLRRFHLGDPSAATGGVAEALLPALLHPYRDAAQIRYEYPLYLFPPGEDNDAAVMPLSEFLKDAAATFAPGEDSARLLKDNLPWLERYVRSQLASEQSPVDAGSLVAEAGVALQEQIGLAEDSREKLQSELESLSSQVDALGQFLGYGRYVAIHLLIHAARHHLFERRRQFGEMIDDRIQGLMNLLAVERVKTASSNDADMVGSSVGNTSRYFDTSAFSGVMGKQTHGSESMSAERKQRIEGALKILQAYEDDPVLVRCIGNLHDEQASRQFEQIDCIEIVDHADPCSGAAAAFDAEAGRYGRIFAAARIADLEMEGAYDPSIHDDWFASFDWQAFTPQELQLISPLVALESAENIAAEGLRSFSQQLRSGKPIQILASVSAYDNPGIEPGQDPLHSYRMELGYFGIGHRQAVIVQSSSARHEHLLGGFVSALNTIRTSLHLVDSGFQDEDLYLDPWIVASAALESRAHPYIEINPTAGDATAERSRFDGNPQSELDWPVNSLTYLDDGGAEVALQLPFTFVDYSLLMPQLRHHFRPVAPNCRSDDLLPVAEYLALPADQADRSLPFVWAVDAEGLLSKVVVSRALMLACRDRLSYWRTLQELAGVRNRHVELAVEKAQQEERAARDAEIEELGQEHANELEQVRSETAGEVMGKLAQVLMGMDLASMSEATATTPAAAPAGAPAAGTPAAEDAEAELEAPEPEPEPAAPEEEEISFDDPYIDSILCTTCDDCMAINKLLFEYNDNKQAVITDPKAGTFAQLVEAAELCPASCIHPGKPVDPNEPGLDELIARAAAHN
jgi:ferredoxin|tara:strand:+ start:8148 stop:10724 length:2577 start_codon:yes stop_codon:yes gene_type:complete